jgi:hypothetical protein
VSKHKSSVVTGAGFLAAFNHNLFVAAKQAGISEEQLYDLLNGDTDFVAKLVKVFAKSRKPGVQSLAAMIAACQFRYFNSNITEANFPITGPVADVADMLTFSQKDLGGQNMTTAQIEAAIDQKGYRPATLAEQLAYAKAKWNGKDWVVALGSSWVGPDGDRSVPYLYGDGDGRKLHLYWFNPEDRWREDYLFLVVRK